MQISRHWRMNAQRYRLVGIQDLDGKFRLRQPKYRSVEGEPGSVIKYAHDNIVDEAESQITQEVSYEVPLTLPGVREKV